MGSRLRLLACGGLILALSSTVCAQGYGSFVDRPKSELAVLATDTSIPISTVSSGSWRGPGIRHSLGSSNALQRRLGTLRADQVAREATLGDLVAQLNALGIPTVMDERSLEDEAQGPDEIVRIPRATMSLGQGVKQALKAIDCGWTLNEERTLVVIASEMTIEETLIAVTYDVSPIIRGDDYDPLINTITSTVEPDAWDDVGGPGTVQPLDVRARRLLVISADFHTHLIVQRLLNSLLRMGGTGRWTQPTIAQSHHSGSIGSSIVALPNQPKKRGIALNSDKSGSTSGYGGFGGGMGGMGGGMF